MCKYVFFINYEFVYFFCRRKENAISSLTKANQLVKTIAIGGRINSEGGY